MQIVLIFGRHEKEKTWKISDNFMENELKEDRDNYLDDLANYMEQEHRPDLRL